MEQPARPTVFSVYLLDAVLLRDLPVEIPQCETVTHFDGDNHELRPFQRSFTIGSGADGKRQIFSSQKVPGGFLGHCQCRRIDVVQHNLTAVQRFALEDIPQRAIAELRTARTH